MGETWGRRLADWRTLAIGAAAGAAGAIVLERLLRPGLARFAKVSEFSSRAYITRAFLSTQAWRRKGETEREDEREHEREVVGVSEEGDVPENAPEGCPGVESSSAGKRDACNGCPNKQVCASGDAAARASAGKEEQAMISKKLASIDRKILVLSGKGGVGKSTMSVCVARELASQGYSVGLLDVDICGPSVPLMTGTKGAEVRIFGEGWLPVVAGENLVVMSIGYLLPTEDGAIIWRGPKKNGMIKQFLTDVYWGTLDYLIVDTPPGTSDEHLSVVTYLQAAGIDGALLVTTPQEASCQDVRKEISFCKQTNIAVLGVIENMSSSVFSSLNPNSVLEMCDKCQVPFAGRVDLDPRILHATENGEYVSHPQISKALETTLKNLKPKEISATYTRDTDKDSESNRGTKL